MKPRTWLLVGLLVALLAVASWLGWSAVRAATQARAAFATLDRLQSAAAAPSLDAVPALRGDLAALETQLRNAQHAARPFLWLAPRLRWLPKVGDDAAAAPALLEMAVQAATAGRQAVDALLPALQVVSANAGTAALPQAVEALRTAAPQLVDAEQSLAKAIAARQDISGSLHPRLEGLLARVDPLLPLAQAGLQASQAAPGLLGADEPVAYLILAQNNHELRATGGFISGAGLVRIDKGNIAELKLTDSYAVDDLNQPHPVPPAALASQMGAQMLLLRDSNWSPDFPQSAEVARALYAQDQGAATDGAIALDLEAVRLLVGALGPLQVPGIEEPVTGENAIAWMQRAWQAPPTTESTIQDANLAEWFAKRKDFMSELVAAALAKLEGGGDLDMTALGRAVFAMLEGRHLQVTMDDPTLAKMLAERGWDGGLRPPAAGDFLAVIDSNVGFNKANAAVGQRIAYRVEPADGGLTATLTLTYTHNAAPGSEEVCDRSPRYGDSYDEMIRRCYWSYVRVYAPGGSELLEATGLIRAETDAGERGTTVFAGDFVLRPTEQHIVTLHYRLPAGLLTAPYRLFVRKQAGTLATPLVAEAPGCRWETDLAQDRAFVCGEQVMP